MTLCNAHISTYCYTRQNVTLHISDTSHGMHHNKTRQEPANVAGHTSNITHHSPSSSSSSGELFPITLAFPSLPILGPTPTAFNSFFTSSAFSTTFCSILTTG